jgi:hypothetical protein
MGQRKAQVGKVFVYNNLSPKAIRSLKESNLRFYVLRVPKFVENPNPNEPLRYFKQ